LKFEAAGKIRVFAICDWWTQVLFAPLHRVMEKVLKTFPQDATFDQDGKVKEFAERMYPKFWSFDLTKATDLIPQQLYMPMMSVLLGSQLGAELWLKILVSRQFVFTRRPNKGEVLLPDECTTYHKYTRGQPMGAKSSWPALALLHHLLVLYAAKVVGVDPKSFTAYLVLGDDVVIADEAVAQSYLKLCSQFEIPIGIAKSFAGARGLFQFANQNWFKGTNISAVSLKADLSAVKPLGAIEFVRQVILKWPSAQKGVITRFVRALVDDGQYASVVHDMKRWRFGATASSIVRTLLSPGNPATGLLGGDTGASVYLWLSSITRGVSISEVNDLTSGHGCSEKFAAIAQTEPSRVDIDVTVAQACGYISELMGSIMKTRSELETNRPESSYGVIGDDESEDLNAQSSRLGVEITQLSEEIFSLILPYLDTIRSSTTYGQLVSSLEFVRQWVDGAPHLMTFEARKGEAPSPWRVSVLPKALAPGVLAVLRTHGIRVRHVPASLLVNQANLERQREKRLKLRIGGSARGSTK
jgi:hypothetical protein